jgi:hypothetical protein
MDKNRRQNGFIQVVGRVIVIVAMLAICRTANAQDNSVAGNVTPIYQNSVDEGGTGHFDALKFGRNALLSGNFAVDGTQAGNTGGASPAARPQSGPTQRDVTAEAHRLQAGVRGGVALDPELLVFGLQAQFGPLFNANTFFRPSVEFAFGEVTAMFGFNGEFIYRLPMSSREDRWSPYFGAGLGINLLHQNFDREEGGKRIDFGDFHSDTALNILGGVRNRSGVFLELRTSVYSEPSPTLRLMVGYNF